MFKFPCVRLCFLVCSLMQASWAFASCEDKFCFGLVLPLSGPVAEYGSAIRNGVSMAIEEAPHKFSKLEMRYEDSEYKPKQAVSAFKKLRTIDHAQLIYTWGGSVSEVVAPVGEQLKAPTLISSVDPRAKIGKQHVLRFSNPALDFGKVVAQELQRLKARRIGVVLTENHYLNSLLEAVKESLSPNQEIIVLQKYAPVDQDFKSTVTKLRGMNFDALGILLLPGQVAQFYRELEYQQLSFPTFGSDIFESMTEIRAAGPKILGAFWAHHVVSDSFRDKYVKKFGNDYQIAYAGQGYDLANFVADLFGDLPSEPTTDLILSILRNAQEREGVTGKFFFVRKENGDEFFSFPVKLRRVGRHGLETVGSPGAQK